VTQKWERVETGEYEQAQIVPFRKQQNRLSCDLFKQAIHRAVISRAQ